jgi:hypothetical protein
VQRWVPHVLTPSKNIYGLKTSVPMSNYQYSLLSVVFYVGCRADVSA